MELLENILERLSKQEIRELRSAIARNSRGDNEIKLLDALLKYPKLAPQRMAAKFFNPVNMNAYHARRRRLLAKVVEWLVNAQSAADFRPDSDLSKLTAARFFIDRHMPLLALHYLAKAEEQFLATRRYDLLETLYKLMIDHAGLLRISASEVAKRWMLNSKRYNTLRKVKLILAEVHDRFEDVRENGFPPNPETIVKPVRDFWEMTDDEANNPEFRHTLAAIVRRAYASAKDYEPLEEYLRTTLAQLDAAGAFTPADTALRASFLYMHAHALYRIREFDRSFERLDELRTLVQHPVFTGSPLLAKIAALEAAANAFVGHNERAIAIVEAWLADARSAMTERDRLNMMLNLAVYRFNAREYRKALSTINKMHVSDRRIDELMGKEWRFKRGMILVIIHYELGNVDLAVPLIDKLLKGFKHYLAHPFYDRARYFLKAIRRIIDAPDDVFTERFRDEIRQSSMMLTRSRDDIQGIAFFCWLRSKMFRRDYYEVLVERLREL